MLNKNKIIIKILRFFALLLVVTFSSFVILNEGIVDLNLVEAAPTKDKDIEDPDDEDFGGIGVYSYDNDENETM